MKMIWDMDIIGPVALGASGAVLAGLCCLVLYLRRANRRLKSFLTRTELEKTALAERFAPVLDAEAEAARVRAVLDQERLLSAEESARLKNDSDQLRQRYTQALQTFEALQTEVRKLEEELEDISYGLYRPHFTYDSSDAYKAAIQKLRDKQKEMIRAGQAASCDTSWTVEGSKREGQRMVRQFEKLILRAFNAESEAAIANVTWNNYRVMRERIDKAFEALNKLGTVMKISLQDQYKEARLDELQLVFEAAEKKQQEREKQRRLRAEGREEERAQRELRREKEEAEKDEAKYQKALERANLDMEKALESEREIMLARIKELEADLAAAQDRRERAIAQAQLTKVGHVYVISNVGTFGEGVLKIGLTRRLDPEERVKELGDASVPFPFDIHAMVYSENAPEMETSLHNRFWDRRINWVNDRKEFFKVTLDELRAAIRELGLSIEVLSVPEAKEYRQTLAAIEQSTKAESLPGQIERQAQFPADPFAAPDGSL